VHTHNFVAGLLMVLQMHERGYNAEFRPFGHDFATILKYAEDEESADSPVPAGPNRGWRRWLAWVARLAWHKRENPS